MWLHRSCRQLRNSSVECGRGFSFDMAPVVLSWLHRSNPCCVSGITEDPSSVPELLLFSCLSECKLLDKTKVYKSTVMWMCLWKVNKQDGLLNVIVMCAVIFEILYPMSTCVYNACIWKRTRNFFMQCTVAACWNHLMLSDSLLLYGATKYCLISFY